MESEKEISQPILNRISYVFELLGKLHKEYTEYWITDNLIFRKTSDRGIDDLRFLLEERNIQGTKEKAHDLMESGNDCFQIYYAQFLIENNFFTEPFDEFSGEMFLSKVRENASFSDNMRIDLEFNLLTLFKKFPEYLTILEKVRFASYENLFGKHLDFTVTERGDENALSNIVTILETSDDFSWEARLSITLLLLAYAQSTENPELKKSSLKILSDERFYKENPLTLFVALLFLRNENDWDDLEGKILNASLSFIKNGNAPLSLIMEYASLYHPFFLKKECTEKLTLSLKDAYDRCKSRIKDGDKEFYDAAFNIYLDHLGVPFGQKRYKTYDYYDVKKSEGFRNLLFGDKLRIYIEALNERDGWMEGKFRSNPFERLEMVYTNDSYNKKALIDMLDIYLFDKVNAADEKKKASSDDSIDKKMFLIGVSSNLMESHDEVGYYIRAILMEYGVTDGYDLKPDDPSLREEYHKKAMEIAEEGMKYSVFGYLNFFLCKASYEESVMEDSRIFNSVKDDPEILVPDYYYLKLYASEKYSLNDEMKNHIISLTDVPPKDYDLYYYELREIWTQKRGTFLANKENRASLEHVFEVLNRTVYKNLTMECEMDYKTYLESLKSEEKKERENKLRENSSTVLGKMLAGTLLVSRDPTVSNFIHKMSVSRDATMGAKIYATVVLILLIALDFTGFLSGTARYLAFIILGFMVLVAGVKCFPTKGSFARGVMLAESMYFITSGLLNFLTSSWGEYISFEMDWGANVIFPMDIVYVILRIMNCAPFFLEILLLFFVWIRDIPTFVVMKKLWGLFIGFGISTLAVHTLTGSLSSLLDVYVFWFVLTGTYGFPTRARRRWYLLSTFLGMGFSFLSALVYTISKNESMPMILNIISDAFFAVSIVFALVNVFAPLPRGNAYDNLDRNEKKMTVSRFTALSMAIVIYGFVGLTFDSYLTYYYIHMSYALRIILTIIFLCAILYNGFIGCADVPGILRIFIALISLILASMVVICKIQNGWLECFSFGNLNGILETSGPICMGVLFVLFIPELVYTTRNQNYVKQY